MTRFYQWMKEIVFCLCFLELLSHLVQGAENRKYLKFVGGLIFMLVLLNPVFQLTDTAESLANGIRELSLEEEIRQAMEGQEELAELQNHQISESYQAELEEQVRQAVENCGRTADQVTLKLEEEDGTVTGEISSLTVVLEGEEPDDGTVKETLCTLFGMEMGEVRVRIGGWNGKAAG